MKKFLIIVFFFSLVQNGYAQDSLKNNKIRELLEVTGAGKMGAQIASQMLSNFQKNFTSVPQEFWEKFRGELYTGAVVDLVVPVYAKYYSIEELEQIITFYKTPIGQKVISVTPQLMQESMEIGRNWGEKVADRIFDELEKNGYKKE